MLGPAADSAVTAMCQNQPFCVMDVGVIVQLWDEGLHQVVVCFLDCLVCNITTGETLSSFERGLAAAQHTIPCETVFGFASDSAWVMLGH